MFRSRVKSSLLALLTVFLLVVPVATAQAIVLTHDGGSTSNLGYTYAGTVSDTDCSNPARGAGYWGDLYKVNSASTLEVYLKEGPTSGGITDPWLQIVKADRTTVLAENDDAGGDDNGDGRSYSSYLASVSVSAGDYVIATTIGSGQTGSYTLYSNVALTQVTTCPQVITFNQPAAMTYGATTTVSATTNMSLPVSMTSSTPAVCTVSGSASPFTVTAVGVGSCKLVATQSGNGSTEAASAVERIFSVDKKNLTVTGLSVTARDYDGTTTATLLGTATLSGVVSGDSVSLTGTPSTAFSSSNAGTYSLTVNGLSISGAAVAKYNLVSPVVSATINKINQTVTWTPTQELLSTDSGSSFTAATTSGNGAITYTVQNAGSTGCTVSGRSLSFTAAGSCTVRATAASTTNYNVATKDITFNVTWLNQTLTWNPAQSLKPSDSGLAFAAATTTGNGAVSYAVQNAGTAGCSVTGSTLTFTDQGGTCVVRATAAGTSIYNAATKDVTFTVTRLTQTISWDPDRTLLSTESGNQFDAATSSANNAITYSVQDAGTAGCTVSGRSLSFTDEGTCIVRATAVRTTDHDAVTQDVTFTTSWLSQTLSWSPDTSLIPSDSGQTLAATNTSVGGGTIGYTVVDAGTAGCAVSGNILTFTDQGGTCVVRATAARNAIYNADSEDVTFTVTRLTQTVSWSPTRILIPSNSGDAFASATSTGTGSFTYTVQNTGVAGCSVTGQTLSFTGEGTCTLRATASRTTDYNVATKDVTFTISKLNQVVTWSPDTSLIPSDSGGAFDLAQTTGDGTFTYAVQNAGTTGCSISGNILNFNDAGGTCLVRATAASTTDYNVATIDVTFTVSRFAQIVTWNPILNWVGTQGGGNLDAASTSANGVISYLIVDNGTPNCSLTGLTLAFSGTGSCTLEAQASRTTDFDAATVQRTFVITRGGQTVTWQPTNTNARADVATITPNAVATSSQSGVIRYSVAEAGTTGCSVNASTGVLRFSEAGTCVVRATAGQTVFANEATVDVSFSISPRPSAPVSSIAVAVQRPVANAVAESTANTTSVTKPLTTATGKIPELRSGRAMMLVNGVERQISVEAVSSNALRAETDDGIVLNLQRTSSQANAGSITHSDGSLVLAPGSKYSFVAEGFAPESEIVIWLFSTPKKLGSAKADLKGSVVAEIIVSLNLEPGHHTLQVAGTHLDGTTRALMMSVYVPTEERSQPVSTESTFVPALSIAGSAIVVFGIGGFVIFRIVRRRRVTSI